MHRLNQLRAKIASWVALANPPLKSLDLGLLRISPVDNPFSMKEQFIPLARNTVIRKLSQQCIHDGPVNEPLFKDLCRLLDASIGNRNLIFLQQVKAGYEHLNPDVELLSGGVKWAISRRQILDDEFWFMEKFSRLAELANFREMNRSGLSRWLSKHGSYNSVQVSIEPSEYELLKVWMLGRENASAGRNKISVWVDKYAPPFLASLKRMAVLADSPFKQGDSYRRVAVAVRVKRNDKIELKLFKDLSEGELIHTMPHVHMSHSQIDRGVMLCTSALFALGFGTHLALPVATLQSGWLLTSTHQLATSLALLSAAVGLLNWHVIKQKNIHYWKQRSDLNYSSIVANNRGVISLLGDRAQDEIFKETIIAYVNILNSNPIGVSQKQLESDVKLWALENCSPDFEETSANIDVDLTEALSLLRQLNIVSVDSVTELYTAKSLELSTAILGSEFSSTSMSLELDGNTVIRNDSSGNISIAEPIAEGYEKDSTKDSQSAKHAAS